MVFTWIDYSPSMYGDYHYPVWADVLGWFITMTSVLAIPLVMVIQIFRAEKEDTLWLTICKLARPAPDWGPAQEKHNMIQIQQHRMSVLTVPLSTRRVEVHTIDECEPESEKLNPNYDAAAI